MAIRKCICKNEFQDRLYGVGMRVMNQKKNGAYRCTCGKEYPADIVKNPVDTVKDVEDIKKKTKKKTIKY